MMSKVDAAFISNVIEEQRTLSLRLYQAEQAVKRVRELHVADYDNACQICIKGLDYEEYLPVYEEYPCSTIQALDGTENA